MFTLMAIKIHHYLKHRNKYDLISIIITGIVAILLVVINIINPIQNDYDAIRLRSYIRVEHGKHDVPMGYIWYVIAPIHNEKGIVDNLEWINFQGTYELVETEYGTGLKIIISGGYDIELIGEYLSYSGDLDNKPSMVSEDGETWPFYFGINNENINMTFYITYHGLIHQDEGDLSAYSTTFAENLTLGWNWIPMDIQDEL